MGRFADMRALFTADNGGSLSASPRRNELPLLAVSRRVPEPGPRRTNALRAIQTISRMLHDSVGPAIEGSVGVVSMSKFMRQK